MSPRRLSPSLYISPSYYLLYDLSLVYLSLLLPAKLCLHLQPPVSPSQAASLSTVLLPCCHSPPTAAGRWLSLKSETAVCDCGWPRVTRGEEGGSPSRAGPRECSAAPFEWPPSPPLPALSCRLIGSSPSQWEAGPLREPGGFTAQDVSVMLVNILRKCGARSC